MLRRGAAAVAFVALATAGAASARLLSGQPAAAGQSTTTAPVVTTSTAPTTLVVTGHGYGHGMGMGQWGAYGYALHGWTAARILGHYFPGTTLGHAASQDLRVLLADRVPTVTLGSESRWHAVDADGKRVALPAGPLDLKASLKLGKHKLVSPVTFKPGKAPVEVAGKAYRGSLEAVSDGKTIELVNVVPIEAYLRSVVSEEMSAAWPAQALEAQAIAARSYAFASAALTDPASPFQLYSDPRSQAYGGIDAENPIVTKAVAATRGMVVLYQGKVALTCFSSSSGGETMSAADGTGTPVPYLVAVPDPYDKLSPYHDWGPLLMSPSGLGKALGLKGAVSGFTSTLDLSGRVATATVTADGASITLTGTQVRDDLGLKSNWFQIGTLSLLPVLPTVQAGDMVELSGTVVGFDGVTLEAKVPGGEWTDAAKVHPDAGGAFIANVKPQQTTQYRLSTGTVRGALIEVHVKAG
jgi:stage II sporulation protein D